MLRRSTRIQLVVFVVIGVLVMGYTAIRYANLGRLFGLRGYYVVHLELANAGGIFPQANVTYRGVSVGRVGAVQLTSTGVEADLNISNSAPPIPADLQALAPILRNLANAGQNLPLALQVLLTYPFTDQVLKDIKGDYLNAYLSIKAAPGTTVIAPVKPPATPAAAPRRGER